MMVNLEVNKLGIVAKDELGNEVWYYDLNGLHASCGEFNGVMFDVDGTQWKNKKGKLSKAFIEWFEEIDKKAYELYYQTK